MINDQLINDRQTLRDMLSKYGTDSGMMSSVPLNTFIFIRHNNSMYQIVGINASFVNGEYVEIFIALDINGTLPHFDGDAVKTSFFDLSIMQKATIITAEEARKEYTRPEWRRVQKFIKKNIKDVISPTASY